MLVLAADMARFGQDTAAHEAVGFRSADRAEVDVGLPGSFGSGDLDEDTACGQRESAGLVDAGGAADARLVGRAARLR